MTRNIKFFLLPLALCFAACDREDTDNAEPNDEVVAAKADDEGHRGHRGLARLDADKDGFISQAEAKDHRIAEKFAELDADKDGKLSRDELQAMKGRHGGGRHHGGPGGEHGGKHGPKDPAERAAHMLDKFDANKDGAIAREEVGEHPRLAEHFAEIDADKDGKLSGAELQAMKGPPGKGEGKGAWHSKDPAERAAHMLDKFDADKDGSLSAAEVAEHPKLAGKFTEVDTDKDGKLSSAELTAFKAKRHGERGERGDRGPGGEQRGEAHL